MSVETLKLQIENIILGRGASGVVYRGVLFHQGGTKSVAVKMLDLGDAKLTPLMCAMNELRLLTRLSRHPNVNTMSHSLVYTTTFIAVSSLCIGDLHHNQKFVQAADVPRILAHMVSGLLHMHSCGILHNDVKPANILIQRTMVFGVYNYVLTDFGISKLDDGRKSDTTEAYKSPTYFDTDVPTVASDFWALGKVLYQMNTGADHKTLGYKHVVRRMSNEYYAELGLDISQPCTKAAIVRHFVDIVVDDMRRVGGCAQNILSLIAYMLNEEPYDYSSVSMDGYEAHDPHVETTVNDSLLCPEVLKSSSAAADDHEVHYDLTEDIYEIFPHIRDFLTHGCSSIEWYANTIATYISRCKKIDFTPSSTTSLYGESLSSVRHLCFVVSLIDLLSINFFIHKINEHVRSYSPISKLEDYRFDIISVLQMLNGDF